MADERPAPRPNLKKALKALGLNPEKAAHALCQLAADQGVEPDRDLGVDRSLVYRWLNGEANPGIIYTYLLCCLCDRAPAEIDLAKQWPLPFDPRAGRPSHAIIPPNAPSENQEAATNRRELLRRGLRLGAAGTAILTSTDVDWERLSVIASGPTALSPDRTYLDSIDAVIRHLEMSSWSASTDGLLSTVHGYLLTFRDAAPRVPSALARDFNSITGRAVALAAWLSFQLANRGNAFRYCSLADDLARTAGDNALHAHVMVIQSDLYSSIQDGGNGGAPSTALDILNEAEPFVGGHPYLRAWLLACRAENYATLVGRSKSAPSRSYVQRDLDDAGRILATVRSRHAGFFSPWDSYRLAGFRGSCALAMGQLREAASILNQAL